MDGSATTAALEDVARLEDVQAILDVCVQLTGMRYAVVAHVSDDRWLACAVLDNVAFGLPVGGELPIKTTLCNEVRLGRKTIAFDHASVDDRWREHATPKMYGLESYIAAPIILSDGEFFGTLCAIDPRPAAASAPATVQMFELFSKLIASQIEAARRLATSEAALLDAKSTAELREQFIAVLGHDLRNPLASIVGAARLLRREVQSDKALRVLDMMESSVDRMAGLIDNVMDFARARLGSGIDLDRQEAFVEPVLRHVVAELEASHPGRTIGVEIEEAAPISFDAGRLGQLTSNLLGNAITHGDPKRPIRLQARSADGRLTLSVANNGAQVPERAMAKLFQPFFRGEVRPNQQGLGLGLHIASEIAKAHGGTLTVASDAGETRFTFSMPASDALRA